MLEKQIINSLIKDAHAMWPSRWHEVKHFFNKVTFAVSVDIIINQLGFFQKQNNFETFEGIKEKIRLFDDADYIFKQMLEILCEEGVLEKRDNGYVCINAFVEIESPSEILTLAVRTIPTEGAFFQWLARSTGKMHDFIAGKVYGEEVMFPNGDFDLVEQFYNTSDVYGYYPKLTGRAVKEILRKEYKQKVVVLEVGSGTGNSADNVFREIGNMTDKIEKFIYTDISKALIKRYSKKYKRYDFMEYRQFDLGGDLPGQNMDEEMIDILFGVNVVHATNDLNFSCKNLYRLLKKGGYLILGEISPLKHSLYRYMELTFGMLGSFYKYDDKDIRPATPFVRPEKWVELLKNSGFTNVIAIPGENSDICETGGIIIAEK
jgi:SAM-dependent methyltransferase